MPVGLVRLSTVLMITAAVAAEHHLNYGGLATDTTTRYELKRRENLHNMSGRRPSTILNGHIESPFFYINDMAETNKKQHTQQHTHSFITTK